MKPSTRNTFIAGLVFLFGTPLVATVLAIVQATKSQGGSSGDSGHGVSTVIVANFACFPFMVIGLILLLVAWAMHRRATGQTGA